jgi:hypothetical protein
MRVDGRRSIEAYAAAHGLEIAEWWKDENQSGGAPDRPGFQAAAQSAVGADPGGYSAVKAVYCLYVP